MKQWIATIVLATLLAGGGVFSGIKITDMTRQLNALQLSYTSLQSNYNSLQSNYNSLQSNYNSLESSHTVLQSKYTTLESNYNSLESDYESLQSSYDVLQGRMSELQSSYNRLEAENRNLQTLLEQYEKVPHAYYSTGAFPVYSNTYEQLSRFLTFEFVLPGGYKVNVFDCSESAAYLEWALENAGFDAQIAIGRTPWNPSSGYHAWVIAHTKEYKVAIEATALTGEYNLLYLFAGRVPGIVYDNDSLIHGWENYYEGHDNLFENIYKAIRNRGTTEEWNWWEGYWGFR